MFAASHVEYLVNTHSRLPGWSNADVSVRRRFRDFVTLAELLKVGKNKESQQLIRHTVFYWLLPMQLQGNVLRCINAAVLSKHVTSNRPPGVVRQSISC